MLAAVLSTVCLALRARSSSRVVGWSLRQVELWYIRGCTCVGSHSGSGDGEDPGWEESPGFSEVWKPGADLKPLRVQEHSGFGGEGGLT